MEMTEMVEAVLDCPLYFIYDTKHDYYVEVYADLEACETQVSRMNCCSRQIGDTPRYEVMRSEIGSILLDVKNTRLRRL